MNTTTSSCSFPHTSSPRIGPPRARAKERGVTLIELLTVLAVIAVLATIGVPSMGSLIDSVKLSSASNVFLSTLHLARSEAIKRNSRVVLCKSADGASCTTTGGWQQGWIIFHDANNNGQREESEKLVQRELPLSSSLKLSGNMNVARYVSFSPSGATKLVGGSFQAGTLTICKLSLEEGEARQIILNSVGRPRVYKTSVSSCV